MYLMNVREARTVTVRHPTHSRAETAHHGVNVSGDRRIDQSRDEFALNTEIV